MKAVPFLALLFMIAAGSSALAGKYQRTRDGRTVVWNPSPEKGEAASWSGKRGPDGYATGEGKLTWYAASDKKLTTGTYIAAARRYQITGEYIGTMVHGRLQQEGDAQIAEKAKTKISPKQKPAPEVAAKGRTSPAPRTVKSATKPKEQVAPEKRSEQTVAAQIEATKTEKDEEKTDIPAEGPQEPQIDIGAAKSPRKTGGSLSSLMRPPSSLSRGPEDQAAPTPTPTPNP